MFGIVRPCRHVMCQGLYADWMSHLCGLCLALRDEHGHLSRLVTNYDGLLVSVLTEAQSPASAPRRRAGACALRGFRGADVVQAAGVRLAASVSLLLAAGKIRDHVADGDGPYARRPVAAGAARLAERWSSAGTATAATLGFDPTPLTAAADRQASLERPSARALAAPPGLRELTGPTEDAVAAAFAHTAVLAGKPHNRQALEAAGRGFGRLAHLIDAVEDLAEDRASGAYNPLVATGTGLDEARGHCEAAHAELRAAVDGLDLARPALTRALLVRETGSAISRAFTTATPGTHHRPQPRRPAGQGQGPGWPSGQGPEHGPADPGAPPAGPPEGPPPRRNPGGLLSPVCAALTCCTCGLYRAPWDEERESSCCRRCECTERCEDCAGCCDGCGECADCCSCCSNANSCCDCDGCCCDCN
ncbi:DUF5685 family protein [Nonomuraea jiangxiensis]|uniref:Regulatory protein n=1 Tax=Nonomuraea jiangxiensis TaxID=633440 RepID=A0A1G9CBE1_9ACTN|nr:DUF5685 family protein [Nonomuraea jiangxiensis]SDK48971.1 hypothetical protein SAMN05421869_116126 [Nonomuraea jiangxiensis]